jgi:hypothetical protein
MTRVGKDPDDLSTLVLVEWQEGHTAHQGNTDVGQSNEAPQEMVFIKSEAALRVVEDVGGYVLGTVAYVLRKIIPRPLRDFVYSYCVAPYRCVGRTCRAGVRVHCLSASVSLNLFCSVCMSTHIESELLPIGACHVADILFHQALAPYAYTHTHT